MQTNMFPPVFFAQSNNNMNAKINESNNNFYNARDSINRSRKSVPDNKDYAFGAAVIGFFVGFFGCVFICYNLEVYSSVHGDYDHYSIPQFLLMTLGTWIGVIAVSAIIGVVICELVKSMYNSHNGMLDSRIQQETARCDQINRNIQNQAAIEQQNYLTAFEQNAQNMSVQLAESELAKEVIQWMTEGFSKTIDAADRRSHIEQISVPFQFKVFVDKITCNLGTYDFELKRCRNLTSPLEQTALARAIAAAIQVNITMKYPKDASGTDRAVNFEFSYTDTHPVATLTYAAPNGNYQAVRSW